jgi:hypothetical protein
MDKDLEFNNEFMDKYRNINNLFEDLQRSINDNYKEDSVYLVKKITAIFTNLKDFYLQKINVMNLKEIEISYIKS